MLLYAVAPVRLPPRAFELEEGVVDLLVLWRPVPGGWRVETGERPGRRGRGPGADALRRWSWSISTVRLLIGRLEGPFPGFLLCFFFKKREVCVDLLVGLFLLALVLALATFGSRFGRGPSWQAVVLS